jgi:hypothetical protein
MYGGFEPQGEGENPEVQGRTNVASAATARDGGR